VEEKEKPLEKLERIMLMFVSKIAGSWLGVILHAAWFAFWLIYKFDINILTLAVSLEAIFIGIFLLIASNKAEIARDRREAAAQKREKDIVDKILDLEEKNQHYQQQILKVLAEIEEKLENQK